MSEPLTYAEWQAQKEGRVHGAALSQKEWDDRWLHQYNIYRNTQGHRHEAARRFADETMERRHGQRPDGPPTALGLGWRVFWLLKVKKMDWKKLLIGAIAAAIGAAAAAIPAAAEGGITANEWYGIGAVALGALALYLKNPDAKGFSTSFKKQQ
jgi:hypothetical protein